MGEQETDRENQRRPGLGAEPAVLRDIPEILQLYKLGHLNLDDMVTREYTLERINDGYRDMLEGRNIRGIIRYSDADRG